MKPVLQPEEGITVLLGRLREGDESAAHSLLPLVYDQLHRLAAIYLSRERKNHTLQPTALIHEAFIRLIGQKNLQSANRTQFFGLAAHLMRQILVDYARAHRADKRGGQQEHLSLDQALLFTRAQSEELLILNDALDRLAALSPRQVKVIELR